MTIAPGRVGNALRGVRRRQQRPSPVEAAGLGVAMGNAMPELKAVADLVSCSNEEDRVGMVLEELLRI